MTQHYQNALHIFLHDDEQHGWMGQVLAVRTSHDSAGTEDTDTAEGRRTQRFITAFSELDDETV